MSYISENTAPAQIAPREPRDHFAGFAMGLALVLVLIGLFAAANPQRDVATGDVVFTVIGP